MAEEEVTTPAEETQPTDKPVETPAETPEIPESDPAQGNLIQSLVAYLKQYNGYRYASISRITSIPPKKEQSQPLQQLILGFMMAGHTDQKEFERIYVNTDVAIIQLHQGIPQLGKDGLYDHCCPGGYVKSIIIPGFFQLSNPDKFEPVIVCRTGSGPAKDIGNPGTLGLIKGSPYHMNQAAEVAEVIKQTQPDAVAAPEAPSMT